MDRWQFHFDNLSKHHVAIDEVEEAVIDCHRIIERLESGLYRVIGKTDSGRLLEVIYRVLTGSDGGQKFFVFHAMTARETLRKRYQKRR